MVRERRGRRKPSREKILQAAETLFHRRGFQPTSLDELLDASGVCRSNFYYHFRSKEDLGLEVLAQQAGRFEAHVILGILDDRETPAQKRLARLFQTIREELTKDAYRAGCPFGNLAAELSGVHPEFQSRLSAFFRRWEEAVDRCLRDGVARGEFRPSLDTRRVATAIISQIEGAVLLAKTHRQSRPLEGGARLILEFLESR